MALKKGSYLDPTMRDLAGIGVDLADPSMAFGGIPKLTTPMYFILIYPSTIITSLTHYLPLSL